MNKQKINVNKKKEVTLYEKLNGKQKFTKDDFVESERKNK
jgi:hypothetical protein